VARDLAQHFRSLEALRGAGAEGLEAVHGIGPRMSEAILEFLGEAMVAEAIDRLVAKMEALEAPEPVGDGGVLAGLSIVFTGTLERLSRSEAKKLVEAAGARSPSSVSRDTDLLVAGPGAGSKEARARELGLTVLDEADFFRWLEEKGVGQGD
jgi:DNA ligase (NAD+)